MNDLERERASRVRKIFAIEQAERWYDANTKIWAAKYIAQLRFEIAKIDLEVELESKTNIETREQYQDYLEAKYEYQDWLRANDCTAIVPTYWHGRVLRATSTMPTYRIHQEMKS